jgi:uncharacterized protein
LIYFDRGTNTPFFFYFHFENPTDVKNLFILAILLPVIPLLAQTYTVETIPNNKLINGSYVSNPDNIITEFTVSTIDSILTDLEHNTTAQVAVVLVNSIGDEDEFEFAQQLFDSWKIGKSDVDNGLLVLLVKDKPVIRFHTGDGIEGILPDATCKRIQIERMVPYFKDGNFDDGMLEGIRAVSDVLNNPETAQVYNEPESEIDVATFAWFAAGGWAVIALIVFAVKKKNKTFAAATEVASAPQAKFSAGTWLLWYLFVPLSVIIAFSLINSLWGLIGGMYAWTGVGLVLRNAMMNAEANRWLAKKDYQAIYNFFQGEQVLFSAMRFLFPLPFAFMYGSFRKRMQFFRDHPRDCRQCGKPLSKLNELADDEFLSKSQLLEEGLKSVDYDVWKCSSCNAADKLTYINPSSKYAECPKCKVRSYYKVSDSVVRAATTMSEGVGEEVHNCKFCNTRAVRRYTIAKVTTSSSSGSSSSSGGSWGGGSSSGGGASSSW